MLKYINTKLAPPPGFYSQGILIDPEKYYLLFLAGQTGNIPETDEVEKGLYAQTLRALNNILGVIIEAGRNAAIIEINVFLKDPPVPDDQKSEARKLTRTTFGQAYERFFTNYGISKEKNNLPVRTLVWVSEVPIEFPTEDTLVELQARVAIPKYSVE